MKNLEFMHLIPLILQIQQNLKGVRITILARRVLMLRDYILMVVQIG